MRVTRLEIFGFKSFVDRFVLNFDRNLIGIVGPNGCGKSNIVDSLRWVLGETHARQLRGSLFDDMIFNGSQSRRPLGMAEVSITIRPNEKWNPATVARVSTPGLDGDLVVSIADSEGEALTIPTGEDEFLSAPELNSQSSVDGASSDGTPADGAGSKAGEPTSLFDIPGLFESSEIQLTRRLYRSGESEYFINRVPCRLRDMTEFYRLIGLGARGLSIVQQGQVSEIISKKPLERRELIEEAAGIAGFRSRIETAERKLERTNDNIARLRDILGEVEKNVKSLARQAKRARERGELKDRLRELDLRYFKTRISVIDEKTERESAVVESKRLILEDRERDLTVSEARELELRAELDLNEGRLGELRMRRDEILGELARRRESENELRLQIVRSEGRRKTIEDGLRRLDDRKASIGIDVERRRQEIERLAAEEGHAQSRLEEGEQALRAVTESQDSTESDDEIRLRNEYTELTTSVTGLEDIQNEIRTIEGNVRRLRDTLRTENHQLQERRIKRAGISSEIQALEKQLVALADSVRRESGAPEDLQGRILLSGIKAPDELSRVLSAALGERGKYLVTPQALELASTFKSTGKPRQFGVIRSDFAAGADGIAERLSGAGFTAKSLLALIEVDQELEAAAQALLSDVYLADTLSSASQLAAEAFSAGDTIRVITPSGEVATPWGWYTTGGEGVGFSFARVLDERRNELAESEGELESATARVQGIELELQREQEELASRSAIRESLLQNQKRAHQLLQTLQSFERKRAAAALEVERAAQMNLRKLSEALSGITRSIGFERRRIEELLQERSNLDEETERLREQGRSAQIEAERIGGELEALQASAAAGDDSNSSLQEAVKSLEQEIGDSDKRRNWVRSAYADETNRADNFRREIASLKAAAGDWRVTLERSVVEKEMLLEDIRRTVGEEIELPTTEEQASLRALAAEGGFSLEEALKQLQPEIHQLRSRLEREGEVDPESIEQYELERTRLEEMTTQLADLVSAAETLRETIKKLTDISKKRFEETFAAVSAKFEELVPRLFGGGGGKLELVNPEDPLASGIEIVVRPPGKKVRSLELLSGGEKALTATALLVAMFLHRAAPICVLDEVDAPLDDANLGRFLDLIKEISKTTQFLMITHNKASMSSMDRLIGISMQEAGVSKALTVTVDEAAAELERAA